MIVLVGACLGLGWWQIGRAIGGNALSFGYAIEWPVFALFVIFVWLHEVRAARRPAGAAHEQAGEHGEAVQDPAEVLLSSVPVRSRPPDQPDGDDPSLRAYNEYLAWLAADPTRRPGDYPA
jgi:hypothetical protein